MAAGKPEKKASQGAAAGGRDFRILIVSGLSGSGKTVALRAVEDSGFYCIDNIPVSLLGSVIGRIALQKGAGPIAVGIDIRDREFLKNIDEAVRRLRKDFPVRILYLEAESAVLVRRFKETRRPHPLGGSLDEAIRAEKKALAALKANADRVIDTSGLSPHELRRLIVSLYAETGRDKDLAVSILSFGFKYGIPQNIDLLFDVRFLPNPHFIPELKALTGKDRAVADFVLSKKISKEFLKKIKDLISFLMPHYIREGKSYLSIAFGCTGGRHRSPAIAEEMARFLKKADLDIHTIHRDI